MADRPIDMNAIGLDDNEAGREVLKDYCLPEVRLTRRRDLCIFVGRVWQGKAAVLSPF